MENDKKTDLEAMIKVVSAQLCQHDVELDHLAMLLGYGAKDGSRGLMHLDRIDQLQSRLDALEAETRGDYDLPAKAAIKALNDRIDALIPDNIRNDGWTTVGFHDGKPVRYKVGVEAPETVEETVAARLARLSEANRLANEAAAAAHWEPETVAAGETINPDLRTLKQYFLHPTGFNFTPKDAPVGKTIAEAFASAPYKAKITKDDFVKVAPILAFDDLPDTSTHKGSPVVFVKGRLFTLIDGKWVNSFQTVEPTMMDNDATIATLKTEIATRDRLLDDQCQTIGKLEDKLANKRSVPTICGYEDITTAPVEVQKIYADFLANVRKAGDK